MGLLSEIFTWWNGNTIGTRFTLWKSGEFVGKDEFGNSYYKERGNGPRRWVIYNGISEASTVPPDWHGWLHHTVDVPPTEQDYTPKSWQQPHKPNMTGTDYAYRPPGSTLHAGERPPATGDYKPWTPE
ncbi:MAG: NADH:ubiquinone oxidoreductase subunit NDUFA12 [Pseudomonadota bacterium]